MSYGYQTIERLIEKKIQRIFLSEGFLKFETDQGNVVFTVDGDCCSYSYFYDFHGVEKLLNNGPVISARHIDMEEPDDADSKRDDHVQAYPQFGEVTSVFSFRNASNGYYGGSLENTSDNTLVENEITKDVLEVEK